MNKEVVRITSLVAGILAAVVALFYAIQGIITLTHFSGDANAQYNIYVAVVAIIQIAAACGLGIIAYFMIKDYLKKEEKKHWVLCATGTYFIYVFVSVFMAVAFWNGWGSADAWVKMVFAIAGLVLVILSFIGKFNGIAGKMLSLVAFVVAFVLTVLGLVNAGGISIAVGIFELFMFISFALYYVFDMIVAGDFQASNNDTKAEAKEEVKAEEKSEDIKVEESKEE